LAIASGIYWELSVRSFIQIYSDLTILLHDVWRVSFFTGHSVVTIHQKLVSFILNFKHNTSNGKSSKASQDDA